MTLHPYASAAYADAFTGHEKLWLPHAGIHVLLRPVPGSEHKDAMGCYPICPFRACPGFAEDLDVLRRAGAVSLVLVTDCLDQPDEGFLRRHFSLCRPYKTHYTYDVALPDSDYSKHHRDRIRRARKSCETREVHLADHLEDWMACYETLVRKRGITGIQNFPRRYFEAVAAMPEATTIAAFAEGQFVSAHIWMRHEGKLYAHLAASTDLGYKLRSAFVIYDHAIQRFKQECIIDFGGGAGAEESEQDGLRDFKRGFANGETRNFLCGAVLDEAAYRNLCARRGVDSAIGFFPAYRSVA